MKCVFTFVEQRISVAEVYDGRERLDSVAFGHLRVLDLDHLDAEEIALVVDVLQFDQHLIAGFAVGFVCNGSGN